MRGILEALAEYDSYAPQVLGLLRSGADVKDIADYPTGVIRDLAGLSPNPKVDEDIAELFHALYAIRP